MVNRNRNDILLLIAYLRISQNLFGTPISKTCNLLLLNFVAQPFYNILGLVKAMSLIYFVTSNANKFKEFQRILPRIGQKELPLTELQGSLIDIVIAKAEQANAILNQPVLVEDTGLFFDGLNGLPGPYIKEFLQKIGQRGLYELTTNLSTKDATARCVIGYCYKQGEVFLFDGEVQGIITSPRGQNNFGKHGWDAVFLPNGHKKTFGEMSFEEKSSMDHRRRALNKVKNFLSQF
jgi:inosine triphosphate pyrophosphatase